MAPNAQNWSETFLCLKSWCKSLRFDYCWPNCKPYPKLMLNSGFERRKLLVQSCHPWFREKILPSWMFDKYSMYMIRQSKRGPVGGWKGWYPEIYQQTFPQLPTAAATSGGRGGGVRWKFQVLVWILDEKKLINFRQIWRWPQKSKTGTKHSFV